jgi:hypothetical protein
MVNCEWTTPPIFDGVSVLSFAPNSKLGASSSITLDDLCNGFLYYIATVEDLRRNYTSANGFDITLQGAIGDYVSVTLNTQLFTSPARIPPLHEWGLLSVPNTYCNLSNISPYYPSFITVTDEASIIFVQYDSDYTGFVTYVLHIENSTVETYYPLPNSPGTNLPTSSDGWSGYSYVSSNDKILLIRMYWMQTVASL